jgi:membrane fusion protein, copper/silver efflux system
MNSLHLKSVASSVGAAIVLLGSGYVIGWLYPVARTNAVAPAAQPGSSGDKIDPKTGRKVLYWHDPMVPNQHFDKPGPSPFMAMQLQPVYADEGGDSGGVKIAPGLQQNLGIRYATVRRQDATEGFDAIGTTQFDESHAYEVQSRATGYIDHLYASAPQQHIGKGAPIASLFVPDWLAPQEEYLALRRSGSDASLLAASRERMRALAMPDGLIASLERSGQVQTHVVLTSPEAGVVSELNVRDGAQVSPGQTLAKIEGLSKLWLIVEIPEALTSSVKPGMAVDATVEADPTQHFKGQIREILPGISASSRTLQARLEIDNSAQQLTPGMLMRVRVSGQKPVSRLLVPSEAVITTGKRSVVIVKNADGGLQPVEITIGNDVGADTEVLAGLNDGDTVVASGQFLIDSEASLKSILPKLETASGAQAGASSPAASSTYDTTGKVEAVTGAGITFSHQPVSALGWPAMTMTFNKPAPGAFADLKVGQTVHFFFKQSESGYQLTKVEPVGDAKGDAK